MDRAAPPTSAEIEAVVRAYLGRLARRYLPLVAGAVVLLLIVVVTPPPLRPAFAGLRPRPAVTRRPFVAAMPFTPNGPRINRRAGGGRLRGWVIGRRDRAENADRRPRTRQRRPSSSNAARTTLNSPPVSSATA